MDNHEASNANERNLIGSDFKSMSENHALSKVGSERLIRPGHTVDDVNQAGILNTFHLKNVASISRSFVCQ